MVKVITAGDVKFKEMVKFSVKQIKRFGYEPEVYNLGGLGFGKKFITSSFLFKTYNGYVARSPYKPKMIRQVFDKTNDFLVWIDGDAFLIGKIDEVDTGDYDIGVMMRRRGELTHYPEITNPCNAGVVFIRHTDKAREFLCKWAKKVSVITSGSDQHALNVLIRGAEGFENKEYEQGYNKIISLDGVKIKLFKTDDYNYYYFNEEIPATTKILHFKGQHRKQYNKYKTKYEV